MKKYLQSIIFTFFMLIAIGQAYSWGPLPAGFDSSGHTAHTDITSYAVKQSVLSPERGDYLKNFGFSSYFLTPLVWMNFKQTVIECEDIWGQT